MSRSLSESNKTFDDVMTMTFLCRHLVFQAPFG